MSKGWQEVHHLAEQIALLPVIAITHQGFLNLLFIDGQLSFVLRERYAQALYLALDTVEGASGQGMGTFQQAPTCALALLTTAAIRSRSNVVLPVPGGGVDALYARCGQLHST